MRADASIPRPYQQTDRPSRLHAARRLRETNTFSVVAVSHHSNGHMPHMNEIHPGPVVGFSAGERDYIRRELDMVFSSLPTVAEGFMLRTWRGGPHAGQPKLPPPAKSLLERGLMRLDTSQRLPRLLFT